MGGKTFPRHSLVSSPGLQIKRAKDRLTGEEAYRVINIFMITGFHIEEVELKVVVRLRELYAYFNRAKWVWSPRDDKLGEVTRKHMGEANGSEGLSE